MNRKLVVTLGLALALALAGCSQFTTGPDQAPDDRETQPDTQEEQTDDQTGPDAPDNQETQPDSDEQQPADQEEDSTEGSDSDGQSQGPKVVEMEARQFEFEPSTVRVEQGRTLRLEIISTDVAHGIGIPAFGIDQRLPAGETKTVEFTPDETGEFDFICSVYCGSGHGAMTGTLIVE